MDFHGDLRGERFQVFRNPGIPTKFWLNSLISRCDVHNFNVYIFNADGNPTTVI